MVKPYLFSLLLIITSCNSKKIDLKDKNQNNANDTLIGNCPPQGNCNIEILKNKSLSINTLNNQLLYELIDNQETTVIHYQYSRNMDEAAYDGGYREEMIFEIESKSSNIELADLQLQKTKMLFGRYCHCRENTGLFTVENGKLSLRKNKDAISFTLNFTTQKIPQEIKNIIVDNNKLMSSK